VVAGVTTCVCVSTTIRQRVEYNYRMMIVSDAVAEVHREAHEAELKTMSRIKPGAESAPAAAAISILPMDIQIGDRFTDAAGEWEVVSHPATLHGAKSLRARVRRTGPPANERAVTWPAHVRVEIRRDQTL
jgi:hypothetical protein